MHWGGQMKVSLIGCFGLRQLAGCCLSGLVDLVGLKEDYAEFVWMGSFCWVSADRRSDFQGVSRRLDSRLEAVWGITNRPQKAAAHLTKKGQFVKWLQNNCCNRITKSNELALVFIFFPHFLLKTKAARLSKQNSSLLSSHPFASESFWKHTQARGDTFPPVSYKPSSVIGGCEQQTQTQTPPPSLLRSSAGLRRRWQQLLRFPFKLRGSVDGSRQSDLERDARTSCLCVLALEVSCLRSPRWQDAWKKEVRGDWLNAD